MKRVIDASVGIKTIIPEHDSAKALRLRDEFRKGIHELFAPGLYLLELSNIIISAHRSGKISATDLPLNYLEILRHQPVISPTTASLKSAFRIASQIRVSVYDAIYLALFRHVNCPLITADAKLKNAAPGFSIITLDDL